MKIDLGKETKKLIKKRLKIEIKMIEIEERETKKIVKLKEKIKEKLIQLKDIEKSKELDTNTINKIIEKEVMEITNMKAEIDKIEEEIKRIKTKGIKKIYEIKREEREIIFKEIKNIPKIGG